MRKIYTSHGEFPGSKLVGKERYQRLYHFTSFDTFIKIWISGKLLFGKVQNVNDMQESGFPISARNPKHWAVMRKFRDLRLKYKQISLSMDYDTYIWGCMSTQMWAYYADKSQGICIELDYSKLVFQKSCLHKPVVYRNYTNEVVLDPNISTTKDIKRFIIRNKSKLFFTKQFTWKGENEYRIVSDTDDYLDISNAISCIYVTDTTSVNFELLVKLVGENTPIKRVKFLAKDEITVPVLTDARADREYHEKTSKDVNQIYLSEQVSEKIEECKDDENKSLLMPIIYLKK